MTELLFEVCSEEIPARMQAKAADDLLSLVIAELKKSELEYSLAKAYVTPRRITLHIDGLPVAQKDVVEEKRGPRVGAPEQALQGFLSSCGFKSIDEAEVRETPKGEFYFANIKKEGRPTKVLLNEIITSSLNSLGWPKSMRWGTNPTRWVRPLTSILCLFGGEVIAVEFAGKVAADKTRGHRFLAPSEFAVKDFADYVAKLRDAKVVLDREERKSIVMAQVDAICAKEKLQFNKDEDLLDEVCGLIEWPNCLVGKIDDAFMSVPQEVLILSMAENQKYFTMLDSNGKLSPKFIVVSNMLTSDGGAKIIAGNEKVLRARLSDAKFFWENDKKKKLETRIVKLKNRIFHADISTDFERVERIRKLAVFISGFVKGADGMKADRAAELCKADLTSEMVGEFPELQGVMGRYYAINDGEPSEVAEAIAAHYRPQGPSDECPSAPVSIAVAMADKIDTLVGFWSIDLKPTGSKDPFALRRACLGVIRLIIENNIRIPLRKLFEKSVEVYGKNDFNGTEDLLEFFHDRLRVHLKDKGIRHDIVAAVMNVNAEDKEDDLVRLLMRVFALAKFLETDDGINLVTAYKRAANIVRIEEKKDKKSYSDVSVNKNLFEMPEEGSLYCNLEEVVSNSNRDVAAERFEEVMGYLARLRAPIDSFFEKVTVNADDENKRVNRLAILSLFDKSISGVADFSKIEG